MQHEYASHGLTIQLVTPMFVRTKMNEYAPTVMESRSFLIPDVESYTKFAVFTLGKTLKTTGYWSHGVQVRSFTFEVEIIIFLNINAFIFQYGVSNLVPQWVRTYVGGIMNLKFREEYDKNLKL